MLSPAIMVNTGIVYTFVIVVWSVFVCHWLDGAIQAKILNTYTPRHIFDPYFYFSQLLYTMCTWIISGSLTWGREQLISFHEVQCSVCLFVYPQTIYLFPWDTRYSARVKERSSRSSRPWTRSQCIYHEHTESGCSWKSWTSSCASPIYSAFLFFWCFDYHMIVLVVFTFWNLRVVWQFWRTEGINFPTILISNCSEAGQMA